MKKVIEIESARISFIEEGEGEILVLIHGLCASTFTFRNNINELKKHFRVFAFDLPGFGESKPSDTFSFTAEEFVDIVARLIRKVFPCKVNLLGSSMGGMIAMGVSLKMPEAVKRLILVSSYCYPFTDCFRRICVFCLSMAPYPSIIQKVIRRCLDAIYYDHSLVTDEVIKGYTEPYMSRERIDYAIKTVKNFGFDKRLEYIDRGNEIKVPVMLIWGKDDRVVPLSHGRKLAEEIPSAGLIEFDRCGHIPYEEMTEKFNNEIINFAGR